MALTLRQVRYFVAAAELGQISRAAIELSISQSAVTTAIKELELTVGTELFTRSRRGLALTTTGREFLSHAYEIVEKVREATDIHAITSDLSGTLSVAATYTVLGYFLPAELARLQSAFPKIAVNIYELNRETIEDGLLSNRYDIAMLLTSNIKNPAIATETLLSSKRRLWVSSKHDLLQQEMVCLSDIEKEPYIMLTVDEAADTALAYWSSTSYQPNVTLRTSSVEAVRSMVANGNGVSILSDMVHRPYSLEGKRIETIVLSDPVPPMEVGLAWRKGCEFTPTMEAFRMFFHQQFQIPQK